MRPLRFVAILIAVAGALLAPARAEQAAPTSFPVPVNVEGTKVRSSLFLRFNWKPYGLPLDTFDQTAQEVSERQFATFLTALRDRRYDDVAPFFSSTAGGGGSAEKASDVYHASFGGLQNITVIGRAEIGEVATFVWEWPAPTGPQRRAFALVPAPDGKVIAEIVTSARPVETLIVDIFQQSLTDPTGYAPVSSPRAAYAYPVPAASPAGPQAVLQFNGSFTDADVFAGALSTAPAVHTYQEAYRALRASDDAAFLAQYTTPSQAKLQRWLAHLTPEARTEFQRSVSTPRRVSFVLEADPIFLVFVSEDAPGDGPAQPMKYQYAVRDTASGAVRLTNAFFEGFFDDVLKHAGLRDIQADELKRKLAAPPGGTP